METLKDPKKRLTWLIDHLDEVSARQWGQPGGIDVAQDPIVKALIKEGGPAVEPLIECLQTDTRLTRSVRFGRDFFRDRYFIPVKQAAYVALSGILGMNQFGSFVEGDSKAGAQRIREYWQRYAQVPEVQRWYSVLRDDSAAPEQWADAAGRIVEPSNVSWVAGVDVDNESVTTKPKPGEKVYLRGESLRSKRDPSVSELMAKRALQTEHLIQWKMAKYLARWDAKAAPDVLRALMNRIFTHTFDVRGQVGEEDIRAMATYTLLRMNCSDSEAVNEYANWLHSAVRNWPIYGWSPIFEPLWQQPDSEAVKSAVNWFFIFGSDWVKKSYDNPYESWAELQFALNSPLLGLSDFRKFLLMRLEDKRILGEVWISEDGTHTSTRFASDQTGKVSQFPQFPTTGKTNTFRVCDAYAWKLSDVEGIPAFQLYWSEKDRDAAVGACATFLQRYGGLYRYNPKLALHMGDNILDFPPGRMSFPVLDHPAARADVEKNSAIFSLEGSGLVRQVKLPEHPMPALFARAVTTKPDGSESPKYPLSNEDEAWVWQAEEVQQDGSWHRFYGVVSAHGIAKVGANEIRFADADWHIVHPQIAGSGTDTKKIP